MDSLICPKGHNSTEPDYCSECGARMTGVSAPAAPPPAQGDDRAQAAPQATAESCPDCGTPRENTGVVFCEICGYNFVSGAHGGLGMITPAQPTPAQPTPQPPPVPVTVTPEPGAGPATAGKWSVRVSVDAAPHQAGSPEPPAGSTPLDVALDVPVSLVGRRSEARGVFPEIALGPDDAVSHRHALLQVTPAGTLLLRDIGSSNGTRLNGQEIKPLTDYPLKDGDEITLGHWTRLTVRAQGASA